MSTILGVGRVKDDGTVPAQRARGGSVMEQSLSKVQAQDDAVED